MICRWHANYIQKMKMKYQSHANHMNKLLNKNYFILTYYIILLNSLNFVIRFIGTYCIASVPYQRNDQFFFSTSHSFSHWMKIKVPVITSCNISKWDHKLDTLCIVLEYFYICICIHTRKWCMAGMYDLQWGCKFIKKFGKKTIWIFIALKGKIIGVLASLKSLLFCVTRWCHLLLGHLKTQNTMRCNFEKFFHAWFVDKAFQCLVTQDGISDVSTACYKSEAKLFVNHSTR